MQPRGTVKFLVITARRKFTIQAVEDLAMPVVDLWQHLSIAAHMDTFPVYSQPL